EIQLHRRSALTDQIFPLELKKKTSPNSENEDVIVAAPPSDDLVTQLGGPLRLGDQVLQINDTPVYNLAQAQELLRNSGNKICVYVMRPSEKASALQVTRDLEHHKGQQSSTILFPHTVYTTRDRLARTIELQQRLLNFKLYKNGVHSTRNNQQLLPCTASQRQDNFWNCLPSQANEYKRRSFNELLASTRNTITSSGVEPSSQWVLKRKTDGTKYITRRIIKRMFDPSVFDIIAFKRGAMLRLVGEILVRDPKTVNLFSLSYGELFLQDSSKLMAKSPSEAWFQRPEWWFSVYMIQVSQRMFDPSVFDIIAFKRGAMLRLVGEILVRDPKTVNLFSLSYGELFLQDSSKLMAKSPSEAWFQRPEWWFSVYMIQVSQFVSFIMTLYLCLITYFEFSGEYYEQIKGVPMGSPISELIAEITMQKLERMVLPDIKPKIWVQCVDDTSAIVKKNELSRAEELLNNVFPDIHFTMETGENNNLAFLDVLVTRTTNGQL
ncbi:hypothetical protein T265_13911, partial [Opisthorchis viverrini]